MEGQSRREIASPQSRMKSFNLIIATIIVTFIVSISLGGNAYGWQTSVSISGPTKMKLGDTITLTATGDPSGGTYIWSMTPGLSPSGSSATFTPTSAGTYTISVTYKKGGKYKDSSDSHDVVVVGVEISNHNDKEETWIGQTITLTANGQPPGGTYSWSIPGIEGVDYEIVSGSLTSQTISFKFLTLGKDREVDITYSYTGLSCTSLRLEGSSLISDAAKFDVIKVEKIVASSNKAENSPQEFEGHKTDFGDPCSATSPGQALIVFYDAVVDPSFQVQDFDVDFKAVVLPPLILHDQLNESWAKMEGPNSGSLNRTDTFEVKYQNPKVGGLYQFEFDLGLGLDCPNSGANLLFPLAGADMTSWLVTEAQSIGAWATSHKTTTENANYSRIPGVTWYNVYRTWTSISGSYFDYVFDPVDAQQRAPCRRYQPTIGPNGQYGYVTVNEVVVHGSKINNMLWALFGRYWGWSETNLRLGAHLNELGRNGRIDGVASQNSIGLGADIYTLLQSNPSANITLVLTQPNLRTIHDPNVLIEERLWPSPYSADASNSTFTRPTTP